MREGGDRKSEVRGWEDWSNGVMRNSETVERDLETEGRRDGESEGLREFMIVDC